MQLCMKRFFVTQAVAEAAVDEAHALEEHVVETKENFEPEAIAGGYAYMHPRKSTQ